MDKSKTKSKIITALTTAFVVIGLYVLALYLPNTQSIIALALGVIVFLLSLYFDRDYRFFRIATVALFMIGLQRIIPLLADLNLQINSSSILFTLNSAEKGNTIPETSLAVIVIIGLVLDFLREKKAFSLNESLMKLLLLGMGLAVVFLSVPSVLFSNNTTTSNIFNVGEGGTVNVYPSKNAESELAQQNAERLKKILNRMNKAITPEERKQLEAEKKALEEKLLDTQKALKEALKLQKEALEDIDKIKADYLSKQIKSPSKKLEQAKEALQKNNIILAEKTLNEIIAKDSAPLAQAVFLSGKLAEGRVDYKKAIKQYKIAVTLDEDNPAYLHKAGAMARTIGNYDLAQKWLTRLLNIREKEKKNNTDLAYALRELADLYRVQSKYKAAEPLYKRAIGILEKVFPDGHPNLDTMKANYDALKKKMAE